MNIRICPGTTSTPVYKPKHTFDLKNSNLAMLAFKKIQHTPVNVLFSEFFTALVHRQTDRQTVIQANRQMDRQTDEWRNLLLSPFTHAHRVRMVCME